MLLTLLLDCSASMAVPGAAAGMTSLRFAKRLAAAFGAVALLRSDAVRVCALADGTAWPLEILSGRAAVGRLAGDLERVGAGGGTDLAGSLRAARPPGRAAGAAPPAGPVVLLSDMLVPDTADAALDLLGPGGVVVHVTDAAPAGACLPGDGTVELQDAETGEVVTVTVTPAIRRRYAQLSQARDDAVAARCAAAGAGYLRAPLATPVAELLFGHAARRAAPGAVLAPTGRPLPGDCTGCRLAVNLARRQRQVQPPSTYKVWPVT
jgi:hypothetical protein